MTRRRAGRIGRRMCVLVAIAVASLVYALPARGHDDCRVLRDSAGELYCPGMAGCSTQGTGCVEVVGVEYGPGGWTVRILGCKCLCPEDPIILASFTTNEPIESFPVSLTFTPSGTWTIIGLAPGETLLVVPSGTMAATLAIDPRDGGFVSSTIDEMDIQLTGLPTGPSEAMLLPVGDPFIGIEHATGETEVIGSASHLFLRPPDVCGAGETIGVVGAFFASSDEQFSFKGIIEGALDYDLGEWAWTIEGTQCPVEPVSVREESWGCVKGRYR